MEFAGKKDTEIKEENSGSGNKKERTLIFACSGLSNTGKLSMQAATTLAFRRPGLYRAAAAHKGAEAAEDAVSEGFRLLALNGCSDRCATKKLGEAGLEADCTLMVTELGIDKTRPEDVTPGAIEKIVRAIREY
ncbi:MAG: putative zinc-binding protein [Methanosarcinaceae archaeon]|nr:putative zinc-binding protein [Methanosarcinaceae archaeon]MDD4497411.1 putative zinc-binding protein [Methanosarcinaceae archaeon]